MPIQRFAPVISSAASVRTRDNRAAAVAAVMLGQSNTPEELAVESTLEYNNLPGSWPQLRSYENDPAELAIPYVWGPANFTPGLRLGFASIVDPGPALPPGNYAYALGAFADNAHRAFLELYPVGSTTPIQTIFSDLMAGSLDPNIEQSSPYNWQFVRTSSGVFTTTAPGRLVLSFEVQNYNDIPGTPDIANPAALSFGFQLFTDTNP